MDQKILTPQELEELNRTVDYQFAQTHLGGKKDYYTLRKHWSIYLMFILPTLIIFQIILAIGVGLKWFDFLNYQWFINIVVSETFLQIVGMCVIIVQFLYPQKQDEKAKLKS